VNDNGFKCDEGAARAVVDDPSITWYQRFALHSNVKTPGTHDAKDSLNIAGVESNLAGCRILDTGTTNGAAASIVEKRRAEHVVAVDIFGEHAYGFKKISDLIGSQATYLR